MSQLPKRLFSIDILRAITMLLMIFVNDSDGISHIPGWIGHAEGRADALGFADTIFPAFLFIVGLSLPLAIKSRQKQGHPAWRIFLYVFTRSAALLIMGFFHVNLDDYNSHAAIISKPLWAILATTGFFLIWLDYPETLDKLKKYLLMASGWILLILLAIIYKGGEDPNDPQGMDPSWWGILGIIGWAYLASALIYLIAKGRFWILTTVWVLAAGFNILKHAHLIHFGLWEWSDASSIALVLGGVVTIELYGQLVAADKSRQVWLWFSVIGVAVIVLGLVLRPYTGGISKIRSTPGWVLICSGITILMFELLIYLADVKGKKDWFKWIRPAGTSTLTCYLIPYYQYFICRLCHINYPDVINDGAIGLLRSAVTAIAIVLLVGLMEKRHLRLKI